MENKHLEVFELLKKQLESYSVDTDIHRYLGVLVENQLKALRVSEDKMYEPEKLSRQDIRKLAHPKEGEISSSDARKKVNIEKLKIGLKSFIQSQPDCLEAYKQLGFHPVIERSESAGGAKNKVLVWLEIEPFSNQENSKQISEEKNLLVGTSEELSNSNTLWNISDDDIDTDWFMIDYERMLPSEIKSSLYSRLFFEHGELLVRSPKGLFFMLMVLLSFIFDVLLFIFTILVFLNMDKLSSFSLWQAILFALFIPFVYLSYQYFFKPLYQLPMRRVIKTPMLLNHINVDNSEIEMYRNRATDNVARITRFVSTCPICTAPIELADGKPDQIQPLVGRCKEAPFAHIYSFDRMTLKGYFLGHEGYLRS